MGVEAAMRWLKGMVAALLLLLPAISSAQGKQPDSLEVLARSYYNRDLDSSRYFARLLQQKALKNGDHHQVAWAYNWMAVCYIRNGVSDSVSHYLDLCIDYCERHQVDDIRAKALLNQSINSFQQGDYEVAGETGLKSLRYFESINDTLGIAHACYNTGLSFHRMNRIEEAREFYFRALPIYLKKGGVLDRANTYNAIGSICTEMGKADSAKFYHEQAVEEKLAVGAWAYCGSEYSNIAAIMEEEGRIDEAIQYYTLSFKSYRAIGDVRGMALVAGNLSRFKLATADWDSAIYYGQISAGFADSTGDRFLLSKSYHRLSRAYEARGDFRNAFLNRERFDSINDLIQNAEVQKNMDELHIKYETEKREKDLANERYAGQRKNFWLVGTASGILALLFALGLLYRSGQERKKRLLATARADLESERNRISMDLHDHLGAELTIITSQLDTQAFRSPDPEAKSHLSSLADQAREASAQLRETIWSVQSTEVGLEQFCRKVREFADRSLSGTGIRFSIHCQGQLNLNPARALSLFRVIQEAVTNARKYSGADTIRLEISLQDGALWLHFSDNGRGFVESEISPGYGLANMRERVVQLGGTIEIKGEGGTSIRIHLPLKA